MITKILAWWHIYWYQFEEGKVWGFYLEHARLKLRNERSPLIATNDPSIV